MRIAMPIKTLIAAALLAATTGLVAEDRAFSADRHAGYYYPEVRTTEDYNSPLRRLPLVTKRSRVGLIVGLNEKQLARNFSPGYHMFAKGEESQKLIVISIESDKYQTLYQLRALLATMSTMARTSPLFANSGSPENLNFLDLCKMAGFTQITLSNGIDVSHQIFIK